MDQFVIEKAKKDRKCGDCPKAIRKGDKHFAKYYPTQYGHSKRINFCKKCALEFLRLEIKRLIDFEKKVKELNG